MELYAKELAETKRNKKEGGYGGRHAPGSRELDWWLGNQGGMKTVCPIS